VKHWGKAVFGLTVTVFLLWWVLHGEDFSEIWSYVRHGNPWLLLASVTVATSGFFIRALRWKILLSPVKADTGLRSRFAAVSIGFMANNVLPARVGEFARAYAFSKLEPVSASAAFGSLVVERFMDGVVLLLFLVVPLMTPGFPSVEALSVGAGGAALKAAVLLVGAVLLALVLMAVWPGPFSRLIAAVARLLPSSIGRPVVDALDAFLDSIAIMRNPKLLFLGFAWTLFFWTWHGMSFWLGMLAFGIHTGPISAFFTEAVVGFGVAIPSAPGFVGTFHASANFALSSVYGVEKAQSLAFAFGYHFGGWIPITVIGLGYAWSLGISLGEVGSAEERVEEVIEERHTDRSVDETE
jgi:glycosyltransferase 2 family protein